MKILTNLFIAVLSLSLLFSPIYGQDKEPKTDKIEKIIKMEDIKQEILGVNKEFPRGRMIKLNVSPLPASANPITAMYKFTLLENGKRTDDLEILTKSAKSTDPVKEGSDVIFTAACDSKGKYQLIFAATYIETKPGTVEIVRVYNPEVKVYDIKIAGAPDIDPNIDPDIPSGTFGMIKIVYDESKKIDVPKEKKKALFEALTNSFSGMSAKIAAGIFKDSTDDKEQADRVNDFLMQSKKINNDAIEAVLGKDGKSKFDGTVDVAVAKKMNELFEAGKMRKFPEYQAFWAEISEGFRLAAKGE
jgi:hypothetical protein